MSKTIIVSNRLPVRWTREEDKLCMHESEGGLATGLSAIFSQDDTLWIGWPGMVAEDDVEKKQIEEQLLPKRIVPVFLSEEQIKGYYEGFSNEILWPIFHYISTYSNYEPEYWDHYVQVNQLFCDQILAHAKEDDIVWIHDYQLLLLPMMLREAMPDITIGFFLHIPFPSQELFRLIPWREELLQGLMGADLLGFQTYDDVRHLVSSASRILGAHAYAGRLEYEGRTLIVESFPISIDTEKFVRLAKSEEVAQQKERIRETFEDQRILLSVDRLDYSKGILQRLMAFETFLADNPSYHRQVVLYMIVVPSRDNVPQYELLKNQIDQEVGRINAEWGEMDWQPVSYFYQSFPITELTAMYAMAEVCLVTPMRDGMNLVCKEYIASRQDESGVLILSEMAGASHELVEAVIINPTNISESAEAIRRALEMPEKEMHSRMRALQRVVGRFDVHVWSESFFDKLKEVRQMQERRKTKRMNMFLEQKIKANYRRAKNRLLLLDYDGTLVGFQPEPEMAIPDSALYELLDDLIADPQNKVVIISGRMHEQLEDWFGDKNIRLIAEHGVWSKVVGNNWEVRSELSNRWQPQILELMNNFADRTPGARVEQKSHSIAWHYRKVQTDLGMMRSGELVDSLRDYAASFGLQVLEGNKVIEVRHAGINKGTAVLDLLSSEQEPFDFILAAGDDRTDEDIFSILPEEALSVKVGAGNSNARVFVPSHREMRRLLQNLLIEK